MPHRILIVDDEPHIREVISFALERAGMTVTQARNGTEAMMAFRRGGLDLMVLDVGMPEMDGLEVCRQVRKSSDLPILFLSARDEEIDRIVGLEIGGDDYVTKPFSARELVARVNTILKRAAGAAIERQDVHEHGQLRLDRSAHSATCSGQPIDLTGHEFAILGALIARPAAAFSRQQLIDAAYGANMHVAERTIDSHVRNIRAKFAAIDAGNPIETIHGIGFRMIAVRRDG